MWISILVAIETAVGNGTVSLTNVVPPTWAPYIVGWCSLLAFIGTTIMAAMTAGSVYGPNAASNVARKVPVFLLGVLLCTVAYQLAYAQPLDIIQRAAQRNDVNRVDKTPITRPTFGDGKIDVLKPSELLDKLKDVSLADLKYAKAQAKATNNTITLPCWSAWVDLLSKAQQPLVDDDGQPITRPDPHVFSTLESASELLQALQNGGPIQTGCAALADASKKSVAQIVSSIVTGGGLSGILPVSPLLVP